jgi:hypothetical protein
MCITRKKAMAQECVGEGEKSAQASEVMAGDKEFLRLKNAILRHLTSLLKRS